MLPPPAVSEGAVTAQSFGAPNGPPTVTRLVPLPRKLSEGSGELELTAGARIVTDTALMSEARGLASVLRRSTGFELPIAAPPARAGDIELALAEPGALGDEGYRLDVTDRVSVQAAKSSGAFYGTMTLRQMFAPQVEALAKQPDVHWRLPRVHIEDTPAYAWRGLTLDVARHFWPIDDVKRLILLCAYHKLNRFHLHLSDDQGWRIEIKSWPKLTSVGGKSQVGGGAGGFFTQEQYKELVAFADAQHVILIPELDMPGHVQAALASYAELNKDGRTAPPYSGTDVGFSSLVFDDSDTLRFVDDAVREVAALTSGPYFHLGGDEAKATKPLDYRAFLEMASGVVHKYQKIVVGWCEAGTVELPRGSLLQHWHAGCAGSVRGVENGLQLIASPAEHAYLDMKYTAATGKGQKWAGFVELEQAYAWQPALPNVPSSAFVGIESALFTEFVESRDDADYLLFPRLAGHAELAWSGSVHNFAEYRLRLAHHGRRLRALGVNFYRSPQVDWEEN